MCASITTKAKINQISKKLLFPHINKTHTEKLIFLQLKKRKKKAELCTETLHILSDGIFVFFSNKKHETNEDVKHEMQIL